MFWRGKRVFLTGHTGFKGSWLALMLKDLGAEVHGYSLPPHAEGIYNSARVADVMAASRYADIRDASAVSEALRKSDAEIVFHLAAQPLVRPSYVDPIGTYSTNVMGTVHVLEAARHQNTVRSIVVVTSDKCYENREWPWGYRENEAMGGHDPYSSSKGCAELVAAAYRQSYPDGLWSLASGRAGNVIGGGDWSVDRLVPDLVRGFREGTSALIRNPSAIRPWQHVLDPLAGYLLLAEHLWMPGSDVQGGWNFGPDGGAERSVKDLADEISRLWNGATWVQDTQPHVHEAHYLKLDSSKARMLLNWKPRWDFEASVKATIEWYEAEDAGKDMRSFTEAQIADYCNRI